MRPLIRQFVQIVAETLPIQEPIYEFGSLQVPDPGQKDISDLRPLFPNKEYVGCDMREGPGVDKVVNLHSLDLEPESAGAILMLDTLEHVEFPRKALEETYRVLRPGGICVISSVMNFPIHEYPHDFWRFTPQGFKSLLTLFPESFYDFAGDEIFPHTVVGIGFKSPQVDMDRFRARFKPWKEEWEYPDGRTFRSFLKRAIPPLVLDMIRKARR